MKVGKLAVDIAQRQEQRSGTCHGQTAVEVGFVETVAFASHALDAVAVNCMLETALRHGDKDAYRRRRSVICSPHPPHTVWKTDKTFAFRKKAGNLLAAVEPL